MSGSSLRRRSTRRRSSKRVRRSMKKNPSDSFVGGRMRLESFKDALGISMNRSDRGSSKKSLRAHELPEEARVVKDKKVSE